jgi:type I restriction-modification system DNA methylase subunit
MHNLFYKSDKKDNFLDGVLETLFFNVLNEDKPYRNSSVDELPGGRDIPYLNGGLFAKDGDDEKTCVFPEEYFKRLFDFLDSYNFTIDENDTEDAEIGIDPEMLGRIFESLLEDNKDKGAYYTPKEIVSYMCQESIIAYLQNPKFSDEGNALIRQFVETFDSDLLSIEQRRYVKDRLKSVKICDPAIGSGAFPMGIVNLLSKIYAALRLSTEPAEIKRHIMENSIYGVDIEKGAVDIARLRFWLAMIVEENEPMPLPNLHFKIMHGNSLIESYRGLDLSDLTQVNAQKSFWDSGNSERESLVSDLKRYYGESDHTERQRIFESIIKNVRRQIHAKDQNLSQKDFDPSDNDQFFLWHTWFTDVFEKGGFDIVIGNPPYLKEGRASKSVFEGINHTPYYKGKMDIWYMFACNGIDLLKENGHLCFIATNNWVTSAGASLLRNKVVADTRICQLCDFNDYMIFDTASIQTMVMLFEKNKKDDNYVLDYRKLHGDKLSDVIDLLNHKVTDKTEYLSPVINRAFFSGKYLTFSNNDCVLDKMRNNPQIIYLANNELANGIHPHYDFVNKKISDKSGFPIGSGIFGLSNNELISLNLLETEKKFIKPYYNGSDLVHRYYTESSNDLWIIYTTSEYKNPSSMDAYPNLKAHLDTYVNVISSDNKPYGLHRSREEHFFIGEKIAALRKSAGHPQFSYSDFDCYLSATFYVIQTARANLKYLTGLLNSSLIEFWLSNRGKLQGENFQLDKEPLQQIPIIVPSVEHQNLIAGKVQTIIEIKQSNPLVDTNGIEKDIDIIVYHLYNITYDEILAIDPETPITRNEYENYKID